MVRHAVPGTRLSSNKHSEAYGSLQDLTAGRSCSASFKIWGQTMVNPKRHCNYSIAVKGSTAVVREGPNECLRCDQEGALTLSFFSVFQILGGGQGGS